MNKSALLAILLFVVLLSSCGSEAIYEKTSEISDGEWFYSDTLTYEVTIDDTLSIYNLYLDLEHSREYPFENMYVRIHTSFPSGESLSKQVSLELANEAGIWIGDCGGEVCNTTIPIQMGAYFNQTGTYSFKLEQYMRRNPLPGVNSITLRIEEAEEQKGS